MTYRIVLFLWVSSHTFKYHKLISYWHPWVRYHLHYCLEQSLYVGNTVWSYFTFYKLFSQFEVWSQLNGNKFKLKTDVHCFCNRQSSIFNITTHHMIVCCYSKWHTRKNPPKKTVSVLLSPTCSHIGVTQSSTGTLNVSSCTFRLFPLFLFRA